jgi:prefoldin subunit 5
MTEDEAGQTAYQEPEAMAAQINEIHQWVQELRSAVTQLLEAQGRPTPPS